MPTSLAPTGYAGNFSSLISQVKAINAEWQRRWNFQMPGFCFRGADDSTFDLNPTLLRSPYPDSPTDLAHLENALWGDFRLRSKPLLGRQVANAWEALFIMQQYGFPTRLLDWTRSLSVAAYFAVRDANARTDGAVWVMASKHLMEIRGQADLWVTVAGTIEAEELSPRNGLDGLDAFNARDPIALLPDQLVPRLTVQHGVYSLHSFRRDALETLVAADRAKHGSACFLHKIVIPAPERETLRQEVGLVAGMREETLFPDLEGFARSYVAEQKRRFSKH